MSRYSSRSLDVGSTATRYDSGSSYKSLDSSSVGSYRSSNLSGYSSHGYGARPDTRSSYGSSTATGMGSSRLHGAYSSRAAAADSLPLPRSSSFGRSEVLSSSTPRDHVKDSYSSSLGRSSSIPVHTEETRGSRYSSRSSALTSNHSLDSSSDAAAERRRRLAERRRQREERGCSETSSDNSKEPSVERASSLRRDSDSDCAGTASSALSRRLAARRLQETGVTEEPGSKDSSPDVAESAFRRSNRRLRGSSGSSEDTAVPASSDSTFVSETRLSLRQRRQQEAAEESEGKLTSSHSQEEKDPERLAQMSAEARRARRQRRLDGLDAASRQVSEGQEQEGESNNSSSVTSTTSRSWRQRLREQGIGDFSTSETDDTKARRQRSQEDHHQVTQKATDPQTEGVCRRQDKGPEEVSRQRSRQGSSEGQPEESGTVGDAGATGAESRAERIARYKEERRKQLAHIANITSATVTEDKEGEALPSLFMSAKRGKEDSPSDSAGQTAAAAPVSVTLTSRLRALRRSPEESEGTTQSADSQKDKSHVSADTARTTATALDARQVGDSESLVSTSDSRTSSSSAGASSDPLSSSLKPQTAPSSRSSPPSASSSQTSTTGKSSSPALSRQHKTPPVSSSGKPLTTTETGSVSSAAAAASGRKLSSDFREPSPKKTTTATSDVRSKLLDGSSDTRKSKSPSPLSSRLLAATRSSAAKGVQSWITNSTTSSPRSSASPRASPVPDKQPIARSASAVSSTKGPPKIKPSLTPEHDTKGTTSSHASKPTAGEGKVEKLGTADQPGSKHQARFPVSQQVDSHKASDRETRQKHRESPQRQTGHEPNIPKLSSSSFSAASSTLSTDRDSGVGSTRLSSSSFSSTRSPDKDVEATQSAASLKAFRLQRTARVEVSSSSSREGSEEKQLPATSAQKSGLQISVQSSVKRTTSLPSRTSVGGGHQTKVPESISTRQSSRSQTKDRKPSSSSVEKDPRPPAEALVSQKSRKGAEKTDASADVKSQRPGQSTTLTRAASPESTKGSDPLAGISPGPCSPPGTVGLDDILAKNAEFLSSDEASEGKKGQRKLRAGEEAKLRRSLRRKLSHKTGGGSRSRDGQDEPGRDSKEQKEGMEAVIPTLTLPTTTPSHSVVTQGEVIRICPSPPQLREVTRTSDAAAAATAAPPPQPPPEPSQAPPVMVTAHSAAVSADASTSDRKSGSRQAEGGGRRREAEVGGSESKEATPDSDSVFHTASSAPSSVEMPRRRREDKSELRKSDLNKASSHPGASHSGGVDSGRRNDGEVSDIRSRFSGGVGSEKSKPSDGGRSTAVARHSSRGKEFSQLLHKFSSSSEASSSERSDSESTQRRRVASFKRPSDREVSSSSDDAQSSATRNIPERSQSLKVVRPPTSRDGVKETEEKKMDRSGSFKEGVKEAEEKQMDRSGSFKSDFMRKRFSPVPQSDAPSEELSGLLTRRHQEVERQQQSQKTDREQIADKRTAQAEHFKSSGIEEVIADQEVASVLRARRKKSDSPEDSDSKPASSTVTQSVTVAASATHELQVHKDSSPETQRLKPTEQTPGSVRDRKESPEEAKQSVSNTETRITTSLRLAHTGHKSRTDTATKEPSPLSARSEPSQTTSMAADHKESKAGEPTTSSVRSGDDQHSRPADNERPAVLTTKQAQEGDRSTKPPSTGEKEQEATAVKEETREGRKREGSSEKETHTFTLPLPSSVVSVDSTSSSESASSSLSTSASTLRRAESLKQATTVTRSESFERKGILKRTPSMPKQEEKAPVVDPQLQRIMEQRRQKELETMGEGQGQGQGQGQAEQDTAAGFSRPRALSAAEEIEKNIRHMRVVQETREVKTEQTEEEAALYLPVSDRIFKMQTKIEEERFTPHTPKSSSGAATPKSARSWSGSVTPRKQISVDEGVSEVIPEKSTVPSAEAEDSSSKSAAEEEVSGVQLMERLNTLAANTAQFQERRQKFQKRHREDWRTRTQPVTLDEIQEADSLDTVSAFRAQVRRNASKHIFDQLKTQDQQRPLPAKGSEFPQHLTPEKRGRRGRTQRHKTLPVTAEELNAIPEGEAMEPLPLRETHEMWKRDSRTDSGILSGSEVDSLGSDSLRSLSLEMDVSDNDPSRLSVSSKTSLFKSLDERARQEREKEKSASGAKRYIDRKKRERSRTQPVTDDEVKTAAEMSEEKKPAVKLPQPEVVNRPKSPTVDQEAEPEDDQLTKLSLAEKVKLFSQKQKEEQQAAQAKASARTDHPVPRRRQRRLNSRFNTQPVTPEELEKASKISPLAMSLVKPPEPELLMGLKVKDQQELMMMHAEATLSQCSSRTGSRPSSQPGSRRGSFTTSDGQDTANLQESSKAAGVSEKGSDRTSSTTTADTTATKKQPGTSGHSELTRTDSEPRGILKKTKSTESVPSDHNLRAAPATETSTAASEATPAQDTKKEQEEDRASPVPEVVLPLAAAEMEDSSATAFFLGDEDLGGESTTDPAASEESDVNASTLDRRRARAADRKAQGERYLTQPAPQLAPERSPQTKRKYEGRHMTQPITPDEMKEAESSTAPDSKLSGGSIADRLNQLKSSGEEDWKRRVVKENDLNTPAEIVKKREKPSLAAVRPIGISDRLNKLEVSAEQWKERVEDSDAAKFTVANKLQKSLVGSESPLVAKIKASSKKDLTRLDDSSNASSPVNSPSTPTKDFLPKVPLPKEIISDPAVAAKKAELKEKQKVEAKGVGPGEEDEIETVRVEVPSMDDEEIEQFFSTKEITEIVDKVDVDIDDFDNIFIESNDILESVRKIRPTRKKKATSRNPLKTVSQFVEIQTEYVQVNTGAAERHFRRMKAEGLKKEAGFALEALAGLASKENFSKVELRKTEPSSLPASLASRRNPFSDLMLLHVKGRRITQTRLVEPSSKSMNAGDCYILVTPDKVINWVGGFSNIIEKAKAAEVANYIQQKRDLGYKSTAPVQTVEQTKDHLGSGKHFWAALQGEKESQACGPEEEDELYESSIIKTNMVYRLEDGALQPYEKYWGAIPKHTMLDKKEVLVFDFGSEFYMWQGKEVSSGQRKLGMALAQKLWDKGYDYSQCAVNPMAPLRSEEDSGIPVQGSKRPDWAIFGKVNQNMETILFREKFADWPDSSRLIGVKREKSIEIKCDYSDIKAYDAKKMTPFNDAPVTLLLEGAHVGRGKKWQEDMEGFIKEQDILTLGIKVWHVMEYEHYQMPEPSYGHFHHGDTYVVRWQYMITNAGMKSLKGQAARHSLTGRERCAYFFWQGQDSTINEKGASALMTVELDEERGPQVRVVQGKEPPCFLNLFEGGMMVHIGKREDATTNTEGPWRLYCLRGDDAGELCLLEIPISITNLRSRSSMVLLNTRTGITYVWHGIKSPPHQRQLAVDAVQNLKEKRPLELDLHEDAHIVITEVEEGEEKAEMWAALDTRDRSLYHSLLTGSTRHNYTPRLFHMTSVSMVFEVIEQMNPARLPGVTTPFPFFQSDLYKASQPALFLLDVGHCVYLWQGWWPVGDEDVENVHTGSASARYNVDRRCAMETTLNYCKERGKGGKVPEAFLVCAGVEPLAFQNMFPFWEVDSTVHGLAVQEGRPEGYCELVEEVYIKLTQTRYTLEELQERPLPDGVDPLKLESYLADEEFEVVLEMKRDAFYALPTWKQSQIKQSMGLF